MVFSESGSGLAVISNPGQDPDLSPHAFKKAFGHPELLVVVQELYSFEKITISEILNFYRYMRRNFKLQNSFIFGSALGSGSGSATGSENGNYFRSDRICIHFYNTVKSNIAVK
jgi:hypothetical protein